MRKLTILLAAVLLGILSANLAHAQSFGLKGGLNMADFGGGRVVSSEYRAGLSVGAFASIPISETLAIQPEVVFSQKGARSAALNYDDVPADGNGPPFGFLLGERTNHNYLEVPVLLKFSPAPRSDFVRPAFFAGPSMGVLLNVREVYGRDYEEQLNSTDFGVVVGGGVELGRLSLDARYNFGLTTIAKDYDLSFGSVPSDVRNRAFAVTAGVRLF